MTYKLIFCCQFLNKLLRNKTGELESYRIKYFKFLMLISKWKFTYLSTQYKLMY